MLPLKTSFNTLDAVRQCSASFRFTPQCGLSKAESVRKIPRGSNLVKSGCGIPPGVKGDLCLLVKYHTEHDDRSHSNSIIYPFINPFIHSCIHLFITHSSTNPIVSRWFFNKFISSIIVNRCVFSCKALFLLERFSFIHSFIHSFIYSFIH